MIILKVIPKVTLKMTLKMALKMALKELPKMAQIRLVIRWSPSLLCMPSVALRWNNAYHQQTISF